MAKVLVVGGAGYIGSHMVKRLRQAGEEVIVLDNLSTGYRDAIGDAMLIEGPAGDRKVLRELFGTYRIDMVMHFASFIEVGESVRSPAKYYRNNVASTLELLHAMTAVGVNRFVFSSSAAVYGDAASEPITEEHACEPVNPYGRTKWMVEQVLRDYGVAYGLKAMSLRYFNAAGADPDGELGERHDPETHLIPLVLQAASGRRESIQVYGRDYPTPDGTCIRDYVHVCDLCEAHLLAMRNLLEGGESRTYNLGNGNGFSVSEVIAAARRVTGADIKVEDAERRPGDPPMLVADSSKIRRELGWKPKHAELETIIAHAWAWERKQGGSTGSVL
jgi:UDP-glucose 4-epimerase